jgi:hypothetical protein
VRLYLEKPFTKTWLAEWLKMKALSSSPSTTHKKKRKKKDTRNQSWGKGLEARNYIFSFLLPISYHLLSQILHCDFKAFFPPS